MKTAELLEQRGAIVDRMNAAHEKDNNEAFNAAEKELKDLDGKLTRAKRIEAAERTEQGRTITGDDKLESEIRARFNLGRAIAGRIDPGSIDDGFEREVQPELAKRAGKAAQGFYIPMELFEKRVLTSAGDGASIVPTDHRPDQYIDALTANTIVRNLGATVLNGLSGNVDIPREAGSPTIGWVAENAALSASDADFDSITLSPKHAGALSEWSRNMVMQSSPQVEMLLRRMLARDLGIAIDKAAILGGGTNEPVGVLSTVGIQTQAYTTDYITTAAEMIAKADISNVDAKRSFLTTAGVRKVAMKVKDSDGYPLGVAPQFHNEPIAFSNNVPTTLDPSANKHGLIYGDWSELMIGVWSEIDILVNPYESTAYSKGNISIRAMATVDCAVRHPAAFVSATSVAVT